MADHVVGDEVEDELIDQVFSYLMYNEYPDDASESKKRIIRKKAKKFVIIKRELFYRNANCYITWILLGHLNQLEEFLLHKVGYKFNSLNLCPF